MFGLIILICVVVLGIYYVTTLDFEVGTGVTEEKKHAREGEYEVRPHTPEEPKQIAEKN